MSFIALKGWNFQTQTFETIEDYFNPNKNTNFGLRNTAALSQIITGLNKVFPRELLSRLLTENHDRIGPDGFSLPYRITQRLIANEEIHILRLMAMQLYEIDFDEEEDEDEPHIVMKLRLEVDFPYLYAGSIDYYNLGKYIDIDGQTEDQIYEDAVAFLKHTPHLGESYTFNFEDNPDFLAWTINTSNIFVRPSYCHALWFHHFNTTRYTRIERYSGGGERPDENGHRYTPTDVLMQWHPSNQIEVSRWGEPYDAPIIKWIVPVDGSNRSVFYRVHNYSTNVAQMIPGPLRHEGKHTTNLYGVELEVATSVNPRDIIDATDNLYCLCKHDTTVTGNKANKMEIVSGPADIVTHKHAWEQILSKVGYDAFDVTRETSNGMHVHVDLQAFRNKDGIPDSLHEKHFVWFFINPINRPFQELISEREEQSLKTYAAPPVFPNHTSLNRLFSSTMNFVLPPFRGIICLKRDRNNGSYVTIEVRAFKGIVSLAAIFKNLEYVDSVFNFTTKTNYHANTLDNYLQYLASTPKNKYTMLKEFLARNDVTTIRETSQLQAIVWGADDPYAVVNLINKHNFPLRHDHLNYLNRLIPGAKFSMPAPGELKVIQTNRSCMYDLDSTLHARFQRTRRLQENVSNPRS